MMYSPHILQVKQVTQGEDDFGRPLPESTSWVDVCACRCDDNTTKEFKSPNGEVYRPSYKIVCDGHISLKAGSEIRVLKGEQERAKGKVYTVKVLNFLNYTEVWV